MRRVFALVFIACAPEPAPSPPPIASLDIPKMPASVVTPPPPAPVASAEAQSVPAPSPRYPEADPFGRNIPSATAAPPPPNGPPPFDKGAAAGALGKVKVATCATPGGPTGAGHITITFDPASGRIASSVVDGGPYPGTAEGSCVARLFMTQTKVPPFSGAPVRVGKSFILP